MEELLNSDPVKKQLEKRSIPVDGILGQLSQFERGSINVELIRTATVNDGIIEFSTSEAEKYTGIYNGSLNNLNVVKFVPASGAASRMFKELISEYADFAKEKTPDIEQYQFTKELIENLSKFAFSNDLKSVCESDSFTEIVEKLLNKNGLNYSNLPKGLIKFHKYDDSTRTAFEEHLVEAKDYIRGKDKNCQIHFTVPQETKSMIEEYISSVYMNYEDKETSFDLSYSVQDPSTDTIAVDMSNSPFINKNGELSFRPAGHGALIKNLNSIDADMIFIKNIDNVAVENYLDETIKFKKLLGGFLIFIKDKVHSFLRIK